MKDLGIGAFKIDTIDVSLDLGLGDRLSLQFCIHNGQLSTQEGKVRKKYTPVEADPEFNALYDKIKEALNAPEHKDFEFSPKDIEKLKSSKLVDSKLTKEQKEAIEKSKTAKSSTSSSIDEDVPVDKANLSNLSMSQIKELYTNDPEGMRKSLALMQAVVASSDIRYEECKELLTKRFFIMENTEEKRGPNTLGFLCDGEEIALKTIGSFDKRSFDQDNKKHQALQSIINTQISESKSSTFIEITDPKVKEQILELAFELKLITGATLTGASQAFIAKKQVASSAAKTKHEITAYDIPKLPSSEKDLLKIVSQTNLIKFNGNNLFNDALFKNRMDESQNLVNIGKQEHPNLVSNIDKLNLCINEIKKNPLTINIAEVKKIIDESTSYRDDNLNKNKIKEMCLEAKNLSTKAQAALPANLDNSSPESLIGILRDLPADAFISNIFMPVDVFIKTLKNAQLLCQILEQVKEISTPPKLSEAGEKVLSNVMESLKGVSITPVEKSSDKVPTSTIEEKSSRRKKHEGL